MLLGEGFTSTICTSGDRLVCEVLLTAWEPDEGRVTGTAALLGAADFAGPVAVAGNVALPLPFPTLLHPSPNPDNDASPGFLEVFFFFPSEFSLFLALLVGVTAAALFSGWSPAWTTAGFGDLLSFTGELGAEVSTLGLLTLSSMQADSMAWRER